MASLRRVSGTAALAAAVLASSAALATASTAPYIHVRITQARDAYGRTIASVHLSTNGGKPGATPYTQVGYPLVFVQPWHTACRADPRHPLPGGTTQIVYLPTRNSDGAIVRWQTVVTIPTTRAQQITLCGYLVTEQSDAWPFAVLVTARVSVAIAPPRTRNPLPVNQGPWRSCTANRKDQVVRLLANRGVSNGCAAATTIAKAWVSQWHANNEQWSMWGNILISYPSNAWTATPVPALHRTPACRATTAPATVDPSSDSLKDEVVNCGLAVFRFAPSL